MAGTGAPMSIPLRDWIAIISSVALNASAQIFLRSGMRGTQIGSLITSSDFRGVLGLFFNLYILGGMACYAVSVLLWMYVLSQQPVGIAYPMMSLAYLFATILGWIFLGESFSALRLLGLACIMIGVWIIARSTT